MNKKALAVVALVVVLVVVVSALAVGGLLQGQGASGEGGDAYSIPVRDDTRRICRDIEGLGGYETNQLFDATTYAMGWTDAGMSEKVGVMGALRECQAITNIGIRWIRYVFYISTPRSSDYTNTPRTADGAGDPAKYQGELDGRKWDLFRFASDAGDYNEGMWAYRCMDAGNLEQRCNPSGWGAKRVLPSPLPFKLEGRKYKDAALQDKYIYDGSVLRVELQYGGGQNEYPGETAGWKPIAIDEARIRTTMPDAEWGAGSYKVGQDAVLNYEIPWTTVDGEPAYYVSVLDLNNMQPVKDKHGYVLERFPLPALSGNFIIPVVNSMFASQEPCTNALEARVYSPVLRVDETSTSVLPSTVLVPGARPTISSMTFGAKQYNKGDQVSVTVKATGNVTKWTLRAHIEGMEALPLTTYYVSDAVLTKTFTAPVAGLLEVEARAYTVCYPSDTTEIRIDVGREFGPYCLRNPSDPICTPPADIPWDLILAIALVIGFVAGLFTYVGIGHRAEWYIKLVAAVLVGALVGVIMYYVALAVAQAVDKLIPWTVIV